MGRTALSACIALAVALPALGLSHVAKGESAAAKARAASPAAGGPRRWQVSAPDGLSLRKSGSRDAAVLAAVNEGAILFNHGCAPAADRIWCLVQPLRGRTRGYVPADHLQPARGPDGTVPMGPDDTAERARLGKFDATGSLQCAQIRGQELATCRFGVARSGGGDATVVVTFSNGFKRTLSFSHGQFIRADTTMSGTGFDTDWRRDGPRHIIRVDDQRFDALHVAIFGE